MEAKTAPRWAKSEPKAPQRAAKSGPGAAKSDLRATQEQSRPAQGRPRAAQERPKKRPKSFKIRSCRRTRVFHNDAYSPSGSTILEVMGPMSAVSGRSLGLCWRSWAALGAYVGGLGRS